VELAEAERREEAREDVNGLLGTVEPQAVTREQGALPEDSIAVAVAELQGAPGGETVTATGIDAAAASAMLDSPAVRGWHTVMAAGGLGGVLLIAVIALRSRRMAAFSIREQRVIIGAEAGRSSLHMWWQRPHRRSTGLEDQQVL
jgi:hypothetical protein